MKRIKKKYLIAAFSLFAVLIIAVTMAYFSDTDIVTNSFTVGDVDLRLVEPKYPEDSKDRVLACGQRMPKDPTVINNGKNDELVFLRVSVPLETVTLLNDNGKKKSDSAEPTEIFEFETNSENCPKHGSITHESSWIWLNTETRDSSGIKIYLFGYNKRLKQGDSTTPLFDKVYLKGFVEQSSLSVSPEDIDITAYGIQADNVGANPENDGTYSKDNLLTAYNAMFDYAE